MKKNLVKASSILGYIYGALALLSALMFALFLGLGVAAAMATELDPAIEFGEQMIIAIFTAALIFSLLCSAVVFIGAIQMSKIYAKTNEVSLVWSIFLLILALPAGICGLIAYFQEDSSEELSTLEKRLAELDDLLKKNVISVEEYEKRREATIKNV